MNTETVTSLFLLFSGEESAQEYEPVISLAMRLTSEMLLTEADTTDVRIDFLAAAMANYHVQQLKCARDRTTVTFAGKMLTEHDGSALRSAGRLLKDYMQLCEDIIKPRSFIFAGFSDSEEEI